MKMKDENWNTRFSVGM